MATIKVAYDYAEKKGRDRFKKYCESDLDNFDCQFLPNDCRQDALCLSSTTNSIFVDKVIIEIKNRRCKSDVNFIANGGVLLEYSKYIELMRFVRKYGYVGAWYVNFFRGGIGYIFDLAKLPKLRWQEVEYPSNTVVNSKKRKKIVTYLKLEWGKKIDY